METKKFIDILEIYNGKIKNPLKIQTENIPFMVVAV